MKYDEVKYYTRMKLMLQYTEAQKSVVELGLDPCNICHPTPANPINQIYPGLYSIMSRAYRPRDLYPIKGTKRERAGEHTLPCCHWLLGYNMNINVYLHEELTCWH